ncbi:MAG: hypothetical protein N3A59_07425 [Thermodesulfovibrionales bacterium]|nr:hypothetical protein [Thermodesulfovibrionales bacterium]
MTQNNYAIIDIGSNTLRMLIGYVKDGKIYRLNSMRAVTRLGEGIKKNFCLSTKNIEKSIHSLIQFRNVYKQFNVKKVYAFGTSALREALNAAEFLSEVKEKIGIQIEIISGDKEAELTLRGIMVNLKNQTFCCNSFLIIDIGGGSTEWVFKNKEFYRGSLPIGAIKLTEKHLLLDPPTVAQIERLKSFIKTQIESSQLKLLLNNNYSLNNIKLIATGGTPTTLATIDLNLPSYDGNKINLHKIYYNNLKSLFESLYGKPLVERIKIVGLEQDRADIIIPGTAILISFMELFDINELIVSDFGILEGALLTIADE